MKRFAFATTSTPLSARLQAPALLFLAIAFACLLPSQLHAAKQLYSCSMHPQIIRDEPGDCPICGMTLVPLPKDRFKPELAMNAPVHRHIKYYKSTMSAEVSDSPGKDSMGMDMVPVYEDDASSSSAPATPDAIRVAPQVIQEMNFKTGVVTRGPAIRTIRTVGVVAYDERGLRVVTTRFDGWIDRLDVDATWASVKVGETLFEIYSPELYNAELNYLVALKSSPDHADPLTRAALQRLRLLGVSDAFIADITRTREARRDYPFPSPFTGIVTSKDVVEGQMIKAGESLFRLADLSRVWVNAQLYEQDLQGVSEGQDAQVRLTYGGNAVYQGSIEQILPQVQAETRSAIARIALPNPAGRLRPGMFAEVRIPTQLAASALLVPDSAVLRSGEHNTAFVSLPGGVFEPRTLVLGGRIDDGRDIVLSGLKNGERIVTSGQFMLDSESQLREALQKMLKPTPATAAGAPAASPNP